MRCACYKQMWYDELDREPAAVRHSCPSLLTAKSQKISGTEAA